MIKSQTLILVDENDLFGGYAPREKCHQGEGRRHRAFVTFLFDSQNRVTLQRRKHRLFDGLWDLTAVSHPLHLDGGHDETYQEASDRALGKEMGIDHVPIKNVGAFNYFAQDGNNCENEYCAILTGNYDGKFRPNKKEVYEAKKVKFGDFLKDIGGNPEKYTPWARLAAKKLSKSKLPQSLLSEELAEFLRVFEPYFANYFSKKTRVAKKYSPIISRFYRDLEDFSSGGKKMRAFLVWLGYRVAGGPSTALRIKRILPISLAFELIHNCLLIHDDIIDESDTRRGLPTIHQRYEKRYGRHYGLSQAILVGDLAIFEAFKLINRSDFEPELKVGVSSKIAEIIRETIYGEALDVEYGYARDVSFREIVQKTDLKTARYSFVGPLTCGAILGGAAKQKQQAMVGFAVACGMAFQVQDDILGVFGDEEILRKSVLSDMREGKNTVLIYKTRQLTSGKDKNVIDRLWGRRDASKADLAKIQKIIVGSGAMAWCREENTRLVRRAKKYIPKITRDIALAQIFVQIADFVVGREK